MSSFRDQTDRTLADPLAVLRLEAADAADPAGVLHDLQVHQIELEIQNRELREAQRALEESRDDYADLYDFAPVAYATLTREGRITRMNLTAARLLGVERGRAPGLVLGTRLAPEDLSPLLASLGRVLSTGEEETIKVGLGRPPEPRRDLRLVISRERPGPTAQPPAACRVVLLDITAIAQAETALRRSEAKFRALFDSTTDAVMLLDEKGFFDCNQATMTLFGCATREAFCSYHPADLSPPQQPCGTDSMTLANRALLLDRLREGMGQAQRHARLLAVAFLDLDGFKAINDCHGHAAGDQLLIAAATCALGDFGAGYASLTYLKRLPAIPIKIDRSFVHDMFDDPDDLAILEGMLGLARVFSRHAIAEGVETVEQGEMLLQLGCELAQGYGIARPMPAADFPGWAATWRPNPVWIGQPPVHRRDLPLLFAGTAHRTWVNALESYLTGKRETPPPLDHHQCRFGMWLEDECLTRSGAQPAFQVIEQLHRQLHALASELCVLHTTGRDSEALAKRGELHGLRDALLEQLKTLVQR
ncbi:EAL domain-containing protein [uncultured Thiodictyon sp.]|jgi:PAS domain-containing protein|uniref:EAL domain-containing protein n=1 Tax=uncultured Thiodictyon sp. TaxID=1846217 RepID=UPI0025CF8575|nr:EAL domain-containing protein [uncultured Thiodictyon sp.]